MNLIKLTKIQKNANTLTYDFSVSPNLKKYFSGKPFIITYPDNIESVPDGILVIPFVCNVLPLVWITNSELHIDDIDKSFYDSIPNFKKGYESMYPETAFQGSVIAKTITPYTYPSDSGACAMFYSGGLDSAQTLTSHFAENPHLITIWGSDVSYDNVDGWRPLESLIAKTSKQFGLRHAVIKSTFRVFDIESAMDDDYSKQLQDTWWHGMKHGIGLIGHSAPYAYLHGINILYIASSYCADNGKVRCASDPSIDNFIRFVDCNIVHDGFEYSRQQKIHNVSNFSYKGNKILLHVCAKYQTGQNCCHCGKCYRTMAGLWAEGVDPELYGFHATTEDLLEMHYYLAEQEWNRDLFPEFWVEIQQSAKRNIAKLKANSNFKFYKWILQEDFECPENMHLGYKYRIIRKLHRHNIIK